MLQDQKWTPLPSSCAPALPRPCPCIQPQDPPLYSLHSVGMLSRFLPRAATCWLRVALQNRTLEEAAGGLGSEEDHLKSKT